MRTVACVMFHDDDRWVMKVLEDLAQYTDEIYVNLNDPTPFIDQVVTNHPLVKKIIRTSNNGKRWNQGLQRDNTLRMLDEIKPDIVLWPDGDESFPKNLSEQLVKFWGDPKALSFWFRLLYLWDKPDQFRNDGLWKRIHHCRAFKWRNDLSFLPYMGYASPRPYIEESKDTRFNSDTPMIHWGYMHEEDRLRKYARGNFSEPKTDKGMIIKPL